MAADGFSRSSPGRQGLDEEVFAHLLVLAGPQDAPELMRRLQADLATVEAGLRVGLARDDRGAVRQHSHVLMAIAGTLGASDLHAMASAINAAAKAEGTAPDAPEAGAMMLALQAVMHRLGEIAQSRGWSG